MFFIVLLFLMVFPVVRQPLQILAALVVMATGLPVYYFCVHREQKPAKLVSAIGQ